MIATHTLVLETANRRSAETLQIYLQANPQTWTELKQVNIEIVRLKNLLLVAVYESYRELGVPNAQTRTLINNSVVCCNTYPVLVRKQIINSVGKSHTNFSVAELKAKGVLVTQESIQAA